MPGSLTHSPADIMRYLLIDKSLGTLPTSEDDWPIYANSEPDKPDNCITVYDTSNLKHGRTQVDGEVQEHHGIQVRIRSHTDTVAYIKARLIAVTLDSSTYRESVTIEASQYCVHSFTRTSDVIAIGKETITPSKRHVLTLNGLVMLRAGCA